MTSPFLFIPQKPRGLFVLNQELTSREAGGGVPGLHTLAGFAGLASRDIGQRSLAPPPSP